MLQKVVCLKELNKIILGNLFFIEICVFLVVNFLKVWMNDWRILQQNEIETNRAVARRHHLSPEASFARAAAASIGIYFRIQALAVPPYFRGSTSMSLQWRFRLLPTIVKRHRCINKIGY